MTSPMSPERSRDDSPHASPAGSPDSSSADSPTAGNIGAILLAGGRARRLDGQVKPLLDVGGRTLLQIAVDAALAIGAHPVTVVGPLLDEGLPVSWVREDPPFGGPTAAVVAALTSWPATSEAPDPEWTLLLACDLPTADAATRRLVADIMLLPSDTEGVCLGDDSSRPQWLIGVYRTTALRRAAATLADGGRDAPVRALMDDLAIAVVAADDALSRDVDTWDDLIDARTRSEAEAQSDADADARSDARAGSETADRALAETHVRITEESP